MKPVFHFLTLFPETITPWLTTSILGRAHDAGLFDFKVWHLRDFATDKHRTVDDVAYGGGGGMVLKLDPLVRAVETIREEGPLKTIYFSPTGRRISDGLIREFVPEKRLLFVCGHYEGVDERFLEGWVDEQLSLGDFVVTGGELPALAFTDALIRQLDGSLGQAGAARTESFSLKDPKTGASLLEYPHYTRPAEFRGKMVPDVLLSGDHGAVARWRHEESLRRTTERRPDLLTTS